VKEIKKVKMSNEESLQKLKNLFENQKKYETEVFVKIVYALTVEVGEPAQEFLGEFIMTSSNTMLIPKIIEILGKCAGDNSIPYIVETMKMKSTPGIARETAITLRKMGSVKAKDALELLYEVKLDPAMKDLFKKQLDALIRENPIEYVWMPRLLLGKSMTSACTSAGKSLAKVAKEAAIPYLIKEALNPDLLIRSVVVSALGEIRSDKVVETLFKVFEVSFNEAKKKGEYEKVINDLKAKVKENTAEETLFSLIESNIPDEFKDKVSSLMAAYNEKNEAKIEDEAVNLLNAGLSGTAAHLVSILKYESYKGNDFFSSACNAVLKEIATQTAEHNKIISEIIMALGKVLEKSRSKEDEIKRFLLIEAEKLENDELKARAIEILGDIRGDDIIEKLKEFTKDKSWKIRDKAVFSLGESYNETAIDTLRKCCEDMHQDVSSTAMKALGKVSQRAVIELFKSGNWRIKRLALEEARSFNDPSIVKDAMPLLADDKYDVAFEAIETIGSIESAESIKVLSALIKKDGPVRIQEKILEKLEKIANCEVLKNLVEALESEVPLALFANLQRTLLNVIQSADYEIGYECVTKVKDICIKGFDKRDTKIILSSVTLASELRGLHDEDYNEIIAKLKEYDKLKSSRNPQEKAIVLAAQNSMSVLLKKKQEIKKLAENKNRIKSLYGEIFDKNEMRSQNAIAEIWGLFSKTDLSGDRVLKKEIWEKFSERFLSPEASPRIRESIAKIFGDFNDPKAVPLLLKFKDSRIHAERLAMEGAIKKLTTTFTKEEIVSASIGQGTKMPPQPQAQQAAPGAPPKVEEKIDYKVLIVDDALVMRNLYSKMLKEAGYITDVAKNGIEAFEKVKNDEFHLVLLDLKLPDVDGIQVLKKLPEVTKNKDIKVIIVSSYLDDENTEEGLNSGASVVLAKPVDADILIQKISMVLR
jgi:two-component system response regulator (stage 0 sporulation protein F)